jgi:CelD/BcsL family acetyltransferase involved in cellulose biosynthesis
MRARVCLPTDLGPVELAGWRAIRSRRPDLDSPFLAPEFTLAVGRARAQARVAVIEDGDGRVTGFFPFERRPLGLGVPIGAGLSDFQAIICEPDVDLAIGDLLAQCGLDTWHFDHLVATERAMVEPRAIQAASPLIDLRPGFEAYLADGEHRSHKALRQERKLERDLGTLRFCFGAEDDRALEQLLVWKSAQYRRTSRPDRFAARDNVQLIRELAETREPDLTGVLVTLHAGDRLVAVELSLCSATVLSGWFPAYDVSLANYSPGSVRTLRTIQAAAQTGIQRYDMGKGDQEYKQWLKTGEVQVCEGWVLRHTALAAVRRSLSLPREKALGFVLGHRRLRLAARATLQKLGSVRM